MVIYGHIWPYMVIYGHIWPYIAIYGHVRPYTTIYDPYIPDMISVVASPLPPFSGSKNMSDVLHHFMLPRMVQSIGHISEKAIHPTPNNPYSE